jgi:hypothetical protein
MQSRKQGVVVAAIGVIVAIVLFVVLSGHDESSDSATTTQTSTAQATQTGPAQDGSQPAGESEGGGAAGVPRIVVKGGQPVGGVQELTFSEGDDIRFVVESDVADEVHLHGYDVMEDVPAGGRVEFDLPATIDGVFEVELEQRVVPLAEITVEP